MAVKFEKKEKVKAEKQVAGLDVQPVATEVVDEYLTLAVKIAKHDAKIAADRKRMGELSAGMLRDAAEAIDPTQAIELAGSDPKMGHVAISAMSNSTRIVDLPKIRELLGDDLFIALAKINLGDLNDYMTKPQLELVTVTERVGGRRLKIVA